MDLKEYLDHLNRGEKVEGGSEVHRFMHEASQEALRITSELNGSYHTPEEIRQLMSSDRKGNRRNFPDVSAVLYGLRKKYHSGKKCFY